ncbi:MAG: amino acid ABC transporter substrate-binding protein [Clostridiales bacterium]|nr:MAG: amino acid ABC transporter substrate-binding protein [Clostridiales bacterium]
MKKVIALVLALVMVFALCACGSSDSASSTKAASSDEKVIKIGVFEPTSGQNAAGGKKEILGIEYAHSLNPTIDINGETYNIELVYADNASDAAKAPSAAQLLISNNVSVVIGTYGSGCAIAAGDLFAEAKIPAIGTSCTNPQVTLGNDYYFRIAYIDPFQGAVMASYALKNGCKNCVVIVEAGDDYSAGFGNYFSEAMVNGGASCDTVTFQTGETDFSTIMANIKSKGYDGIFAPVSIETAPLIINQAREAGVDCQIMAGDTWDDISIAERAGANANGVFFSAFFDASDTSNEAGVEFNKGILEWIAADATRTENNGGAADAISSVTPCGYDAYMAAYNAILAAQSTDGEAIRDALASLEVKGLVTGDLKFDENGDAIKNYVAIKTFQDGKIVFSDAYTG